MGSSHTDSLAALLQRDPNASQPELKRLLTRLDLECRERSALAASAPYFSTLARELCRIRGRAHAQLRVQCLYACMSYLVGAGEFHRAIEFYGALIELAQSAEDQPWLRKAHTIAGIVTADSGDLSSAVIHYARALEIAFKIGDRSGQLLTASNLGVALNYGGLYREALPSLRSVVQRCDPYDSVEREIRTSALCNLSQTYFALGEVQLASECIHEAISNTPDSFSRADTLNGVIRYFTLVEIVVEIANRRDCRLAVDRCRALADSHGSARALFLAKLAEGLFEMRHGNSQNGLDLIRGTLDSAVADIHPHRLSGLRTLARAYDEASQPELALATIRELLGLMKESRGRGLHALLQTPLRLERHPDAAAAGDLRFYVQKEAELRAKVSERALQRTRIEMLERLAISADLREEASGEHGFRVGALARLLAMEIGSSKEYALGVEIAGRLHDLGKIGLPDRILLSPSTLQEAEKQFIVSHTRIGAELLSSAASSEMEIAQQVALHHHEWWNGEGYPSRLAGKRIPVHARIVALADVFDALTHGRPFSPPWPIDKALAEIRARRGTQFDPELTDVFLNLIDRLISEHEDLDAFLGKESRHSPFLQARNKIHRMLEEHRDGERSGAVAGNQTRH